MWRLILITFGFLGFAFYELSGGSDYRPNEGSLQVVWAERAKAAEQKRVALAQAKPTRVAPAPQDSGLITGGEAQIVLASASGSALKPQAVIKPVIDAEKAEALTAAAVTEVAASDAPEDDIRAVTGSRVNLRGGPGTDQKRIGRLTRGTKVKVLSEEGGWVKLQVVETFQIGYMADFLLEPVN